MSVPGKRNGSHAWSHSQVTRREALQAGAVGILGLGMNHLAGLREAHAATGSLPAGKAKKLIFIFLSGGLAQHESFDMKPSAPENIRGEFKPIVTKTPGLQICEHLPMLAQRSEMWALCRSLTHGSNEHSAGHHMMLTGHSDLPTGFSPNSPSRRDRASIAAIAGYAMRKRQKNNLPTAVVLPERLVHNSGRVIPGQHAGEMGPQYDPWMIEASPFHNTSYGAFPQFAFDHQNRGKGDNRVFQAPQLSLPNGLGMESVQGRLALLESMNQQRRALGHHAQVENFDRLRQGAVSLLTESTVHDALDVTHADAKDLDRYGRNSFGWSLLMARKLVAAGVTLVQVNLGNDETWDTHGNAFPHLKDNLLPPTDKAVSALLDDLHASGELDETLIVMAGEFGRTPQITLLEKHYKLPGRDHWGALQSVFFAGGGIRGGNVVGQSDAIGAYPVERPVKPENFAATLYSALGIPATAAWHDVANRPHQIYHGEPIAELF
ncbi:DUF1501 domain-containing protein [Blastopirellula marina]|uniref:DUF1501 domain-containing protein n=1 Tax=Blastopirellula marina TaxID=124 RepID=A0A2S8FNR6_9BACT|nr:DUF1501 domain-containing protein [Blastopirellula marina]PQO33620.1 DUF1501 domain-containing protein [Blastopirellula marina]PTL43407.1 DUF1501 domain-containing protein [Blastopirellula marina]